MNVPLPAMFAVQMQLVQIIAAVIPVRAKKNSPEMDLHAQVSAASKFF